MPYMLFLLFSFSSLGTYPTDLDVKRCRSHSLLVFLFLYFPLTCYSPNFFRPAFLRCATLVIYWSSIHRPSLRATSWNGPMQGRHRPFYTSLITCCCCVHCGTLSPFDCFCFDRLSTCLVPDSFLQCKPFLEESSKSVQRPR